MATLQTPAPRGKGPRAGQHKDAPMHEDGVLMKSLTYANKCRLCRAEIAAGGSAWYSKEAASGQRVTCIPCHDSRDAETAGPSAAAGGAALGADDYGADAGYGPVDGDALGAAPAKAPLKKRAPMPKVDDVVLRSKHGMSKLYKIAASREGARILGRRGNESTAKQLGRVLKLYKDWANKLVPALEFGDVLERTEKLGGTKRVREHLLFLRDVSLGIRSLDELDPPVDVHAVPAAGFGDDDDDDGGGADTLDAGGAPPPPRLDAGDARAVDADGRARMEAQRLAALAKRRAAAAAAAEAAEAAEAEAALREAGIGDDDLDPDEEAERMMAAEGGWAQPARQPRAAPALDPDEEAMLADEAAMDEQLEAANAMRAAASQPALPAADDASRPPVSTPTAAAQSPLAADGGGDDDWADDAALDEALADAADDEAEAAAAAAAQAAARARAIAQAEAMEAELAMLDEDF